MRSIESWDQCRGSYLIDDRMSNGTLPIDFQTTDPTAIGATRLLIYLMLHIT